MLGMRPDGWQQILNEIAAGNPMIGRAIGNYVITGEIARGGMGVVYRARHATLPRIAVVKCIRPIADCEEALTELRARFRREAFIQAQLDHPNIVRVYEFFVTPEECFLVMEYVAGRSVRSHLDEEGVLGIEPALSITAQALRGLAYAHGFTYVDEGGNRGAGIIHRDIKPDNLLMDAHGTAKLADFGIVKTQTAGGLTKAGTVIGTVDYMSPEQIRGLTVDARSDLYSLGATLYEMLAGRAPYPGKSFESEYDLIRAHIETDPPPVRSLRAEIPPRVGDVVDRSLDRDPARRFQTAGEFLDALASCQPGQTVVPAPGGLTERRRLLIAGASALGLGVTGVAVWRTVRGTPGGAGVPVPPSVAVLPFADLSPAKDQQYFSDGLAEELTGALARVPGLRVTARSSAFQFDGKSGDPRVAGKKLNVAAVLKGSVRKQGERTRISVQLLKSADGTQLWSQIYDRELTNIFAVQEEIARDVAGALEVRLMGDRAVRPAARAAVPAAYSAYLQARYFLAHATRSNLEKAATYLDEAIRLDPAYAPAWVAMGECRSSQAGSAYIPAEPGYRQAREAVERALALDGNLSQAHAAMAEILMLHDWNWSAADAAYKQALTLEPGNAAALRGAGSLARFLGRSDDGIALYRRSLEIDPLSANGYKNLGMLLYYVGRRQDAMSALRKGLEFNPSMAITHSLLCQIHLAGDPRSALEEAEKEPHPIFRLSSLALAYHALGSKERSGTALGQLITSYGKDAPYQVAQVYAFRGQTDPAFEWLERAYRERDAGLTEMIPDPLLTSLRPDARYTNLAGRMRLLPGR